MKNGNELRKDLNNLNQRYFDLVKKSLTIRASFSPIMELVGFIVVSIMLYNIGQGHYGDSFGPTELLPVFAAIGLLIKPLKNIGEQLGRFQETKGALKQSLDSFYHAISIMEKDPEATQDAFTGNLNLKDFKLIHSESFSVELSGFDLNKAKTVAIIGPSGSGKTSFIKSLAGLFEADQWIANGSQTAFSKSCAFVSQKPFLFDASLRENLLYGREENDITDEKLIDALKTVAIYDELKQNSITLDSIIGGLNSSLSGGQMQRITIARALLQNKQTLLLDEATSAINMSTEARILDSILELVKKLELNLIFITHRTHCLSNFDEVYLFEKGRIKLKGQHKALISNKEYSNFLNSESLT